MTYSKRIPPSIFCEFGLVSYDPISSDLSSKASERTSVRSNVQVSRGEKKEKKRKEKASGSELARVAFL